MPDGLFANPLHWVILIVVVLIIFGPGKLPGVGSALGKSLREFKKASREDETAPSTTSVLAPESPPTPAATAEAAAALASQHCAACGHDNELDAQFCRRCGRTLANVPAAEVVKPAETHVACTACATVNHASNRFCAHCGRLLDQAMSRV